MLGSVDEQGGRTTILAHAENRLARVLGGPFGSPMAGAGLIRTVFWIRQEVHVGAEYLIAGIVHHDCPIHLRQFGKLGRGERRVGEFETAATESLDARIETQDDECTVSLLDGALDGLPQRSSRCQAFENLVKSDGTRHFLQRVLHVPGGRQVTVDPQQSGDQLPGVRAAHSSASGNEATSEGATIRSTPNRWASSRRRDS